MPMKVSVFWPLSQDFEVSLTDLFTAHTNTMHPVNPGFPNSASETFLSSVIIIILWEKVLKTSLKWFNDLRSSQYLIIYFTKWKRKSSLKYVIPK